MRGSFSGSGDRQRLDESFWAITRYGSVVKDRR